MGLSKEALRILKKQIQANADMFYQQNNKEAFELFGKLLNEISTLSVQIFELKNSNPAVEFDENKYLSILTDAMNALESRDEVLLADIINYDLLEILETVEKQL